MSTGFNIREKNFGSAFMESKILRAVIHQFTASKPGPPYHNILYLNPPSFHNISYLLHIFMSKYYICVPLYIAMRPNQPLYIGTCTLFRAYPPKTHQKPNISYLTCINHYILCFKCATYITTLYLVFILFLLLYIVPGHFPPFPLRPHPISCRYDYTTYYILYPTTSCTCVYHNYYILFTMLPVPLPPVSPCVILCNVVFNIILCCLYYYVFLYCLLLLFHVVLRTTLHRPHNYFI